MAPHRNRQALYETFERFILYLQYDFSVDLKYVLINVVLPLIVAYLVIHGSLSFLKEAWKLAFPPKARELHRSALGALHRTKRLKKDENSHYKAAEKLLQRSIAKDESYFPAYLSLACLYLYRMEEPDKALDILKIAKDRGAPLNKLKSLMEDVKAIKAGDKQMVNAGGAIFQEQEYLSFTAISPRR